MPGQNLPIAEGQWKVSVFTRRVSMPGEEIALYNSFMGAVARIPTGEIPLVERCLAKAFIPAENGSETIRELCQSGFFVPASVAERELVDKVLDNERERGFHLILLPHENCNFRCTYCYESFARGIMNPQVVCGLERLVERKAAQGNDFTVSWFGGEPLLARDIVLRLSDSFRRSCARHKVSYRSGMTTNGSLLSPSVLEDLVAQEVRTFQVTLDGPEELHNLNRKAVGGRGTFAKIRNNIVLASQSQHEFSMTIRINYGEEHTRERMEPFLEELKSDLGNDPRFKLHFHAIGRWGGPNDDELAVCGTHEVGRRREELVETAAQHGFAPKMVREHLRPHGSACYAGRKSSIVVGSDGAIYKCTVAFDDPVNRVGQILEDGHLSLDQEKWSLWTDLADKDTGKCGSCGFSPSCQSRGCPLVAIRDRRPPCPVSGREIDESVKSLVAWSSVKDDQAYREGGRRNAE